MPPRPRPRPRVTPVPSSPIASLDKSNSNAPCKESKKNDDSSDDDSLFMRNKGRSLKEVNKRVARAEAIARASSSLVGSDEDEDDEGTPKPELGKNRKQNIFNTGKAKALPKWAKKGGIQSLLAGSDSEAENNDPSSYNGSPSKRRRTDAANGGTPSGRHEKRARTRSRSKSLTPPPDLTQAEKLRAQIAIEHVLNSERGRLPRPQHPVEIEDDGDGDEMGDTTVLDPELENIAQAVRNRASKQKGSSNYGDVQQSRPGMARHNASGGPTTVTVRVKWTPHPEDDVMRGRPQQSWIFNVKRHDSFKELFSQTSDKTHVLAEDLVLMRDGKQVFTSVSPDGLGIWDRLDLEACDRMTFEALRLRHLRSPTPSQQDMNSFDSHREPSTPPSEASVNNADKFKLVLRASGTKEITLSVRSTTTCGKIVRAFLAIIAKHGSKVPSSPRKASKVQLCIDGEKQDPDTPISDCDLEDGDMVEVVGL